jgi:hypothetical protein
MDYLTKFNQTFNEFIDDIISLYPNDVDLRVYQKLLTAALSYNSQLIINTFKESVVTEFGDQLLNRDETFFLNKDYSDLINKNENNVEYNAIIKKIKDYWSTMSDNNKDTIWKYFRVLILLSKKIVI